MISLDKRQLVAITKFCDSSKLCGGISYLGNAIEACNGPIAIRVQLVVNGIKEEKIRIPKTALLDAIAAMDKDDVAIISADNIKVDRIHIGFEPLEQLFFEDLTPVFNSIKDGLPDRFIMFDGTLQNKINAALSAFGIYKEKEYGTKEKVLCISGQCEFYEVQVAIAGINLKDSEDA